MTFRDQASGVSTTDLHDAEDQILQLNTAGELIWTADGTRLPGYRLESHVIDGVAVTWINGKICPETCAFEVRFSTTGGGRAYLTVDYGHDNPGTLVDVEVEQGKLVVTPTSRFPPGSPTLSGVAFERTLTGQVPVPGVDIAVGISSGWRSATTDARGFYEIRGLVDGHRLMQATKDGFQQYGTRVPITGDATLDIQLVRQIAGDHR